MSSQGTGPEKVDSRPIRVVTQADFVYNGAGARQYFTGVAASPDPTFATISTSKDLSSFLTLGDWNRDGKDDLFDLTSNYLSVTLRASDPASADLGAKGSTYQLAFYTTRYYTLKGLAAGDWDGDGYDDSFVAAKWSSQTTSYQVHMRRTNTGGSTDGFVYQLVYTTSDIIQSVAAGDFNGDAKSDIALTVYSGGAYSVKLVLSKGTSSCRGCTSDYGIYWFKVTGTPRQLAMGDWDRDGLADVIFAEERSSSDFRYRIVFGRKGFPTSATELTNSALQITSTTITPVFMASGDWNADGADDLFVVHYTNSVLMRDVKITYSGATGPGSAATAGTITITLYEPIYSFAVGDWSGDSVFARYTGTRTGREIPVPVAVLTPPPFDSRYSSASSMKAFYGTGTAAGNTYTGSMEVSAGLGISIGQELEGCFLVCLAKLEWKVETTISGHITLQWGRETETRTDVKVEVSGDQFRNPATGTYEPVVLIAHWLYDDYKFGFFKRISGTIYEYAFATPIVGQSLKDFVLSIPEPPLNVWLEAKYLSNYNAGKEKDMPAFTYSRTEGDLYSYRVDSAYTQSPLVWSGPLAFTEYNAQHETSVTLTQGTTVGWETGWKLEIAGKVSACGVTLCGGFTLTAGLARSDLWTIYNRQSITIGGQVPTLASFVTDSWSGEEYEVYGYWTRAYVKKLSLPTRVSSVGFSLLVLDWKVEFLNEGYPALITTSSTTSSSVTLSWMHAGGVDPSGASRRTGYYVQWSTKPNFNPLYTSPLLGSLANGYTVPSLATGTVYYFRVKAVFNSPSGFTSLSPVVSITTAALFEDFDDGVANGFTLTGLWHVNGVCKTARSAPNQLSYHRSGVCNYDTGVRNSGTARFGVDLTGRSSGALEFYHQYDVEQASYGAYDVMRVDVSTDGGASWVALRQWDSRNADVTAWTLETISLTAYVGGAIQIRFFFDTIDAISNGYPGWYLDDVKVSL